MTNKETCTRLNDIKNGDNSFKQITCFFLMKECLKFLSLTYRSNFFNLLKSVIQSSPIFCKRMLGVNDNNIRAVFK